MDAVLLARIQFALTVGFHFIFPPLTIGLAWLLVGLMSRYRRSGAESDARVARFWIKLFSISFAVGVATGITMEFQFGTNWATYSRFVGDIFGAPLAAEAVLSFFLESVFLGVLLFGWNRLSRGVHEFAAWMVAVGATLSAFWIIVADSWMQTPTGFVLRHNRAELTNFWVAVFNHSTLQRFFHTVDAALITGAFFMLGISAWFLLRNRYQDAMRRSLKLALIVAFIASVTELGLGHIHAVQVAETQPAKLATFEGLLTTQRGAPLMLFGIPDARRAKVYAAIRLPYGLSLLVHLDPNAVVQGLDAVPHGDRPPFAMTFSAFHLMVAIGMYLILFTAIGIFLLWRRQLYDNRLFLRVACWSIPLPFLASELGWIAAEVGRQPWIVYHVLLTRNAVSVTVPAWQVLASIIMFSLLYAFLFYAWTRLLRHEIHRGVEEGNEEVKA